MTKSFRAFFYALCASLVLVSSMARAAHPEEYMRNPEYYQFAGNSMEEKEIRWVWFQLPTYFQLCIYSDECGFTDAEKNILNKMLQNGSYYFPETVEFISEKSNAKIFTSSKNEIHRIAVTDSKPGKIYFNTDRLTQKGKSLGFAYWAGILTHELTHHLGYKDDAERFPDIIGQKMANVFAKAMVPMNVPDGTSDIQIFALNFPLPNTALFKNLYPAGISPRILIQDSKDLYNFVKLGEQLIIGEQCAAGVHWLSLLTPTHASVTTAKDDRGGYMATVAYNAQAFCYLENENRLTSAGLQYFMQFGVTQDSQKKYSYNQNQTVTFGLSHHESSSNATITGEVLSMQVPATVKAGEPMIITGRIQAPEGFDIKQCAGKWSTEELLSHGGPGSFGFYQDSCELKKVSKNVYDVKLVRSTSAQARTKDVVFESFCLSTGDPDVEGCVFSFPKKRTVIQIVNSKNIPAAKILSVTVRRATLFTQDPSFKNYFTFKPGQTVDLEIVVDNASSAESVYFEGYFFDRDENQLSINGALTNGAPYLVKQFNFKKVGTKLVITFEIDLPMTFADRYVTNGLKFDKFMIFTDEFETVSIQFPWRNFAIVPFAQ